MARLQAMTSDQFKAPDRDAPKTACFVGVATPYQRALMTIIDEALDAHDSLHDAIGIPGGAHAGLPIEHRLLHVIDSVGHILLFEDFTQVFKKIGSQPNVVVDRNWRVYYVPQRRQKKPVPKSPAQ